jgi:hypothetical protein
VGVTKQHRGVRASNAIFARPWLPVACISFFFDRLLSALTRSHAMPTHLAVDLTPVVLNGIYLQGVVGSLMRPSICTVLVT